MERVRQDQINTKDYLKSNTISFLGNILKILLQVNFIMAR